MELNNKCFEILKLLYEKDNFISIKDLSNELGYIERTIRYNIEEIEDICLRKKYFFLKKDYKKGICLIKNEQSKNFFNEYVKNTPAYTYKYTK